MNLTETGQILLKIATYSKMSPPHQGDIAAWHDLPEIQKMRFSDAERAVIIYYQQHKSPMAAVDLIQTVKALPSEEPRGPVFGRPGEIQCSRCRGVHFPQESCSVLIPMPDWFREKYAAAAARVGIPVPEAGSQYQREKPRAEAAGVKIEPYSDDGEEMPF